MAHGRGDLVAQDASNAGLSGLSAHLATDDGGRRGSARQRQHDEFVQLHTDNQDAGP